MGNLFNQLWSVHSDRIKRLLSGRADLLWYPARMRLKGIDLSPVVLETLGLSEDRALPYGDSGGPNLRRVLKTIALPKRSKIADLGCGKGGAILTLAEFPFSEIAGVDLSADLIEIAEANVARAGLRNVRFIRADAAEFTDLDSFTHLYMYHPFPCAVMRAVMKNLAASLARAPRDLTVIYCNPVCHDTVAETGLFQDIREISLDRFLYKGNRYRIYSHRFIRAIPPPTKE